MKPTNRIGHLCGDYETARCGPDVVLDRSEMPACRTTRIGHRSPHGAISQACDGLCGLLAIGLVLAGLMAATWIAGYAFGAGFKIGLGL